MTSPRTPKNVFPRRDTFLKGGRLGFWPFFKKGWQGWRCKPVDIRFFYAKSLIVDRVPSTGWGCFYTGWCLDSTGLPVFSTDAVSRSTPFLSLLIIDKEEERRETGRKKQQTAIHGFRQLLKKASTGFHASSTGFRGIRGLCSYLLSMAYARIEAHPRIHGWKCVWVVLSEAK